MEIRSINTSSVPQQQAADQSVPIAAAKPVVAAVTAPAPEATAAPAGSAQLAQAVGHLNQTMKTREAGLEFSIDEESHRTVVKVIDQQTKELIRQMPSAEALEISKALEQMQGLLINQKA